MAGIEEAVFKQLIDLIQNDKLILPTLPEIALRAREIAESPDSSSGDIAKAINNDPAMSARIIKVANSPLMRGPREITDIQMAISRLGLTCICNLITGLAMEQMFQATSDVVDKAMRKSWSHATEVAGIAHVLCRHYAPHLKPDQALLAGMIHEIGILPILTYAEESSLNIDPITLEKLAEKIHPFVGTKILEKWGFPSELVIVPRYYLKFDRGNESGKADYTDLVMVANLQSYLNTDHPYTRMDWKKIPAFARIGIEIGSPEQSEDLGEALSGATMMLK
ncbi:conserved hypothetical protein [gamma proteobacterium HdN1]|nr:conserved hypothetical protein [gamma proteobacterium HdN1]